MERLETRIPPPLWAVGFGLVILLVSRLDLGWETASGRTVGLAVAGLGVVISALGIVEVTRSGTSIDPHDLDKTDALVTGGIYRLTRNPMYLGLAGLLLGLGLGLGDPVAAIVGVGGFVAVITRLQILPEERMLAARFGDAFVEFRARTRRWI